MREGLKIRGRESAEHIQIECEPFLGLVFIEQTTFSPWKVANLIQIPSSNGSCLNY